MDGGGRVTVGGSGLGDGLFIGRRSLSQPVSQSVSQVVSQSVSEYVRQAFRQSGNRSVISFASGVSAGLTASGTFLSVVSFVAEYSRAFFSLCVVSMRSSWTDFGTNC